MLGCLGVDVRVWDKSTVPGNVGGYLLSSDCENVFLGLGGGGLVREDAPRVVSEVAEGL